MNQNDNTNTNVVPLTPFTGGRKKARRFAMQSLYSWYMSNNSLKDIETHTLLEHASEHFDREYFKQVLYEVPARLSDIADALNPHLARAMEELDPIELSVLRVATFELLYRPDIPYKVVINEALELVKTFGATESHKFVNGVLDKVARDCRQIEMR
jgi:N utilization substance protein B